MPATAIVVPSVPREFRGVWVASVWNQNWPSAPNLSTAQQKAELVALLDRAAQLHLNAVVLQIRPTADAFYASSLEPWSSFLTGHLGQAPQPLYDPLAFAVAEAHKRGLELHAWYNPFRATISPQGTVAPPNHVTRTHPELVRQYGKDLWLDPGEPGTTDYVLTVVRDIVRRYDIDGIQIDDYYYPYLIKDSRNRLVDFPDDASYQQYEQGGGVLSRPDWRRDNINTFIQRFYETVKAEKKWVKVGISPFGIWRPGNPAMVKGLDSYAELYADSKLWLNKGWCDYFAPQLYWRMEASAQPYAPLLKWWTEQNTLHRHLWPGLFTSRVDGTDPAKKWDLSEITRQIQATRIQPGATGNIHFSMNTFTKNGVLDNLLSTSVYAQAALVPASPWLEATAPVPPHISVTHPAQPAITLVTWQAGDKQPVREWVAQTYNKGTWTTEILPGQTQSKTWQSGKIVAISAVDRYGNQSQPTSANLN